MVHKSSLLRLVPEAAPQPSTPPAPRRLGAVELVPGQVRAAVVSMAGRVLDRTEVSYDAAGATGEDLDQALAEVAELLAAHDLLGVGV
ncbi:MAG: ROK family protein, partial [Streptomyces albidoflavus]